MSARPIGAASPHTPQAWRAWLGGFNLLPHRERDARAMRRRVVALYGVAMLLGALGAGMWVAGATWTRARVDAERVALEARMRQRHAQLGEAQRTLRLLEAADQRRRQAARLAAPYRSTAELLVLLARFRDDGVRLDGLRITPDGAVLDARAVDYPAAARWLARIARERQAWAFDIDALKPATTPAAAAEPASIARMPLRFSVQVRWPVPPDDAVRRRTVTEGRT
ncbi:fimbrial protein [Burkholderia guangdongensis]|uniref:fimbrial protein n=1 Tax=Burkholderia guangdongensis TaxID=1792500 RepID=UPI0015CCAD28|nr:fimbrial protein [Burkholderia guangdongensis]